MAKHPMGPEDQDKDQDGLRHTTGNGHSNGNGNGNPDDTHNPLLTAATILRQKGKPRKRLRLETLSAESYNRFLRYIEAGAYDHVAAASLGVNAKTFYAWLNKGRKERERLSRLEQCEEEDLQPDPNDLIEPPNGFIYLGFLEDVEEAKGKARLLAEVAVAKEDPKWWLTHGSAKQDWSPNIQIGGTLQHDVEVTQKEQFPADEETLAGALYLFQELGLIEATEEGQRVFNALEQQNGEDVVDVDAETDGNGEAV